MKKLLGLLFLIGLLIVACQDSESLIELPDPDPPFNPFDTVNYDETVVPNVPIDSNSFLGIHTYILKPSCDQPACHDGTFEPDYRTVQSSYNTLVFHPVKKNFPDNPVPFRITPFDANQSMAYRRITEHNPPNFERMPSSGNELPQQQIQLIKNWIDAGAPDIYGNVPELSSNQPVCYGLVAFNEAGQRIDSIRGSFDFNPFLVRPSDGKITISFLFVDVLPNGDNVFGDQLTYNKIRLSEELISFGDAQELEMTVPVIPQLLPLAFSQPIAQSVPYYQTVTIDPAALGYDIGDIVYLRTYVQDSDHDQPTEIPTSNSQLALQTYFAFIIQ